MAIEKTFNGLVFRIPEEGDTDYANDVTGLLSEFCDSALSAHGPATMSGKTFMNPNVTGVLNVTGDVSVSGTTNIAQRLNFTDTVDIGTPGFSHITADPATGIISLHGAAAVAIPVGSTAERPSTPSNGMLRTNDDTGKLELYSAGKWNTHLTEEDTDTKYQPKSAILTNLSSSGIGSGLVLHNADGSFSVTTLTTGSGLSVSSPSHIDINYAGTGAAPTVARSDHNHDAAYSPLGHNHDGVYLKPHPVLSDVVTSTPKTGFLVGNNADGSIRQSSLVAGSGITVTNGNGLADPNISVNFAGNGVALTVAHSDHNHDTTYAPVVHNHDTAYAPAVHNHDSTYAPLVHNHDTTYAPVVHNHDDDYQPLNTDLTNLAGAAGYGFYVKTPTGVVTRAIQGGAGIQVTNGGGDTNNPTISIKDNSSIQKIQVKEDNGIIGTRQSLNFIAGNNVTIDAVDNTVSDQIDVTFSASVPESLVAIKEDGVLLTSDVGTINFTGGVVSTVLDGDAVTVNISGISGVTAGAGLTGGGTSGSVTVSLADTTVAAGTYTHPNITVDAQGRITSASSNTLPVYAPTNATYLTLNNHTELDNERRLVAGTGIAFDTSVADSLTVSVDSNTTTQKVEIAKDGTLVSARKRINLIQGDNVTITAVDNSASDRVDVTINGTAAGLTSLADDTNPTLSATLNANNQMIQNVGPLFFQGGYLGWKVSETSPGYAITTNNGIFTIGAETTGSRPLFRIIANKTESYTGSRTLELRHDNSASHLSLKTQDTSAHYDNSLYVSNLGVGTVTVDSPYTFNELYTFPTTAPTSGKVIRAVGDGTTEWADAVAGFAVQSNGSQLSSTISTLNFTGAGVSVAVSGAEAIINIPGGGGASTANTIQFTAQTTDATLTTIGSHPIATDTTKTFIIKVYGRSTTGDVYWKTIHSAIKNVAGGVSLVPGTVQDVGYDTNASGWDVSIIANDTTNSLDVTAVGAAATTINWQVEIIDGSEQAASGSTTLAGLTDVDTTGAANGSILKFDGTSWVVGTDTDTATSLLEVVTTATATNPQTIDCSTNTTFYEFDLNASITFNVTNAVNGKAITLALKQDATGNRGVTLWSGIRWADGEAYTPSTGALAEDLITLVYTTSRGWRGSFVKGVI